MRKWILPLVVVLIAVAMVFAMVFGMSTETDCSIEDAVAIVADVEVLPPGAVDLEPPAELVDNRRPTAPAESKHSCGMYCEHGTDTAANITRTGRSLGAGVHGRPICTMQRVDNITRTGRSLGAGVCSTLAPLGVG